MKKTLLFISLITVLLYAGKLDTTILLMFNPKVSAEYKPIPSYAKWGTLAVKKTQEKYPNAKIIDYLHIGKSVGNKTSIEKFTLWLKESNKIYEVFIYIEFTNDTEKVIEINFKEVS